jgi:hypothetical protein
LRPALNATPLEAVVRLCSGLGTGSDVHFVRSTVRASAQAAVVVIVTGRNVAVCDAVLVPVGGAPLAFV